MESSTCGRCTRQPVAAAMDNTDKVVMTMTLVFFSFSSHRQLTYICVFHCYIAQGEAKLFLIYNH
jgi:hypothetical protein